MTTTCTAMLERMLEADLGELTGRGDAVLATHVRECARCRAVADRLARDTEALGRSIRPASRSVPRAPDLAVAGSRSGAVRAVPAVALIAVAASLASIAIRPVWHFADDRRVTEIVRLPETVPTASDVSVSHSSGAVTARPGPSAARAGDRDLPRRRASRPTRYQQVRAIEVAAVTVAPTVIAAAERPMPVAPVKLDAAPRQSLGSVVAVDPPTGKHADIIRTNRPGVTVVWLR